MACVRAWQYTEPEPLYGRYTTRNWSKYHINRQPDPEHDGEFFYMTEGFTLYSVRNWTGSTGILHGKLFDGIYSNSLVLWGYHMKWEILTEQEWNRNKSRNTHILSRKVPVKIITCDDTRTITVYKKNNNGKI